LRQDTDLAGGFGQAPLGLIGQRRQVAFFEKPFAGKKTTSSDRRWPNRSDSAVPP
jgi:hypothetical protein